MSHNNCYACHGTKKLMGMGMITKDCYVCDGVGYIAVPKSATIEAKEATADIKEPMEPKIEAVVTEPTQPSPPKRKPAKLVLEPRKRTTWRERMAERAPLAK